MQIEGSVRTLQRIHFQFAGQPRRNLTVVGESRKKKREAKRGGEDAIGDL